MAEERLQKILAAAGLGSRRSCEDLIVAGRVTVDGEVVAELGAKGDPRRQEIRCDGEIVRPRRKLYYLINKPCGVVCTNKNEAGRQRVVDLLPARDERLFTVGRLDANTEGLLIVTNDGSFAQRVAHPSHGVTKTYLARVKGKMSVDAKNQLLRGVWIAGCRCKALGITILKRKSRESLVEITMQEGRKREVRRMLAKVGHGVAHLARIRIGPVQAPELKPGRWRKLTPAEVELLLNFKQRDPGTARGGSVGRARRSKRATRTAR